MNVLKEVFATNSVFIITISLQTNVVDLNYFKLSINSVRLINLSLKYQRVAPSGCKNFSYNSFEDFSFHYKKSIVITCSCCIKQLIYYYQDKSLYTLLAYVYIYNRMLSSTTIHVKSKMAVYWLTKQQVIHSFFKMV